MKMSPHDSSITSSSDSNSSCSAAPAEQIDSFLAGAGYVVRSSELRNVAERLEHLENFMVNSPMGSEISHHLANDVVHQNPSDLGLWVDSLLSELNSLPVPEISAPSDSNFVTVGPTGWSECDALQQHQIHSPHLTVVTAAEQEDYGIRLVHALMTCAASVQRGEFSLAGSYIDELQLLLTRVNSGSGIGKVAGYFIDALTRRLYSPQGGPLMGGAHEEEIFYSHFYEAAPYLKFAHFTANQAILDAFSGHDCVHVIDFNLMHGLQWPSLIQALALRPGGPPLLRLTGIGPPSQDGRDSLREIGLKLAELARSVNVRFAFRGVAATRLDDIKSWMLQAGPNEAVAVNSIMQLHKLLGSDPVRGSPIDTVLGWVKNLNPKVVTVVEQEANHNQTEFLERFTEALYYYSTMFDSLEACRLEPVKALAEMYIQREICNVVCCEGVARVERHEPLGMWKDRLMGAGFRPLNLGSDAFKQASMLLTLFSAEGYNVEEKDGCLTLGWHSRPLVAASAWHPILD